MYAWANRGDTTVVDEPMYAYYLKKTGISYHPGTRDILQSLPWELTDVVEKLILCPVHTDIYFIKGMAHHYLDDDYSFLLQLNNVFLIRDPLQLITSYTRVIDQPTMDDIGLQREWELFTFLQDQGHQPIVLDSNRVLQNPKKVLRATCQRLEIPFSHTMLSWPAGPIAEDGCWGPYWYGNVWKSTGWSAPDTSQRPLRADLQQLYQEAMLYYHRMQQYVLI